MKAEFNIPGGRSPDDHANLLAANEYAEFLEFLREHYTQAPFTAPEADGHDRSATVSSFHHTEKVHIQG